MYRVKDERYLHYIYIISDIFVGEYLVVQDLQGSLMTCGKQLVDIKNHMNVARRKLS